MDNQLKNLRNTKKFQKIQRSYDDDSQVNSYLLYFCCCWAIGERACVFFKSSNSKFLNNFQFIDFLFFLLLLLLLFIQNINFLTKKFNMK